MFLFFCGLSDKASAKDIAVALGYADTPKAIKTHCKCAESFRVGKTPTLEIQPQTIIIPKKDVYRLVLRSNLPAAEKFQDWVMDEVLPSVREHGFYGTEDFVEMAITDPG